MLVDMLRSSDTLRKEKRLNLQGRKYKRAAMVEVDRLGGTVEPIWDEYTEPGDACLELTLPAGYGLDGLNQLMCADWQDVLERTQGLDLELLSLDDFDESDEEYQIIRAALDGGS